MKPLRLEPMTLNTSFLFLEQYILHILKVSAHRLPSACTATIFYGSEDLTMALKGFLFSFLGLKIFFTGLAEQIQKGKKETLQNPVSRHAGQEMMKFGIGLDRILTSYDLFFLFPEDFFQLI